MTQERAVRTRAELVSGAATEFATYGYVGSSVNRIVTDTGCTKGAMYFHFASKLELADAVLDAAATVYATIANRWVNECGVHPLAAMTSLVDDTASAYDTDHVLRAAARLSLEPEFFDRESPKMWEESALVLARRASEKGCLREGFSPDKLVRVLRVSLTGCRLSAQIGSAASVEHSVRSGYAESVEVVLAAATSQHPSVSTGVGFGLDA